MNAIDWVNQKYHQEKAVPTFKAGDTVSPKTLGVKGKVKILADGNLTKKLNIEGCKVSESAKVKIEKAGGTVKL